MEHFNKLTPAQAERLALLLEELGEAQQAIGKILRHGYESRSPLLQGATRNNRDDLEEEVGHVVAAIRILRNSGDIRTDMVESYTQHKLRNIGAWLHHQQGEE